MRYESTRDVELRLRHSVVMYQGRPVMVMQVEDIDQVVVEDILQGESKRVKVSELDLQPSSAPLGYIIHEQGVFMAMRKPVRKFKQGLTQENMIVKPVTLGRRTEALRRSPIHFGGKEIARTMIGSFPDIGKAFQDVRSGRKEIVPFSRDWAVADHEGDLSIAFRGEVVGYATDNSVKLLPERFYLKESLELCL